MNKRSKAREAALNDSRNVAGTESGAVGAELVRHLQVRDEAQRSAIARLLHHDVSGMLAAARMDLSRISGRAEGELRELVEESIADLAAVMEPGLSALIAAHARGASPQAAAGALWQEFLDARDAVIALAASRTPAPTLFRT